MAAFGRLRKGVNTADQRTIFLLMFYVEYFAEIKRFGHSKFTVNRKADISDVMSIGCRAVMSVMAGKFDRSNKRRTACLAR